MTFCQSYMFSEGTASDASAGSSSPRLLKSRLGIVAPRPRPKLERYSSEQHILGI